MTFMWVRNRVRDYATWKRVFDEQADTARDAGLRLLNLWRAADDPNDVFFVFEVQDVDTAEAYVRSPASQRVGERAGVIDGEIRYLESAPE